MSEPSQDFERLDDLIHHYCDGTLDEASHDELEQLLSSSESASNRFIEFVQIWAQLMDWADVAGSEERHAADHGVPAPSIVPFRLKSWLGLGCVAALLALTFFAGIYFGNESRVPQIDVAQRQISVDEPQGQEPSEAPQQLNQYIARVVEVTQDAVWGNLKPQEFLLRLAKGEQLELHTGTVRIEFAAGASVLLSGPAHFEVLAGDAARLLSGRMTGRAEDGNFELLTPTAKVIDLGTEFGVSIDEAANTDVCVFEGEVDVDVVENKTAGIKSEAARLTQGMALRVEQGGVINQQAEVSLEEFHRHNSWNSNAAAESEERLISLVDIIAGGDGRQAHLAGAIDPRTGDWDLEVIPDPERPRWRSGSGRYLPNHTSPLIDGVFIPSFRQTDTVLDSSGGVFAFGEKDGATWGPIWSRRHAPNLASTTGSVRDFWGTDTLAGILGLVERSQHGVVGMHANVGLTIDLRTLNNNALSRFRTQIANLDNSKSRDPEYDAKYRTSVDFWVFVDGQLQFSRRDFDRDEGVVDVEVTIPSESRFLTLVSTDGGNGFSFDHLVLIDPILQLGD